MTRVIMVEHYNLDLFLVLTNVLLAIVPNLSCISIHAPVYIYTNILIELSDGLYYVFSVK